MSIVREFFLGLFTTAGFFTVMVLRAFHYMATRFRTRETLVQMDRIGVGSIPIVFLASLFAGLDMALQFESVMAPYGARAILGRVVATSIIRDLGPVLASLVMSARVTSGITSEIGMMNVTQQVDALRVMGVDPIDRLVAPRLFAGLIMNPILSVTGDFLGLVSGLWIAVLVGQVPAPQYWAGVREALTGENMANGLIKPFVFGFILTAVGCYYGIRTSGGAYDVGRSTTKAVVASAVWILVANFLISKFLLDAMGSR